jgi:hypothetical protein
MQMCLKLISRLGTRSQMEKTEWDLNWLFFLYVVSFTEAGEATSRYLSHVTSNVPVWYHIIYFHSVDLYTITKSIWIRIWIGVARWWLLRLSRKVQFQISQKIYLPMNIPHLPLHGQTKAAAYPYPLVKHETWIHSLLQLNSRPVSVVISIDLWTGIKPRNQHDVLTVYLNSFSILYQEHVAVKTQFTMQISLWLKLITKSKSLYIL